MKQENYYYVGRQPIFNPSNQAVAHQLIYQSGRTEESDENSSAHSLSSLLNHIEISHFVRNGLVFVDFDNDLVLSPHKLDVVLSLISSEIFVPVIDSRIEFTAETIKTLQRMHETGYRLTLDHFNCSVENIRRIRPVMECISYLKIDIAHSSKEKLRQNLPSCREHSFQIIGEQIETQDDFLACQSLGLDFYQGYFFQMPAVEKFRRLSPSTHSVMELVSAINSGSDTDHLVEKFRQHPDLTINLLQFINSAAFSFRQEIGSIQQAIVLVGRDILKKWLLLFLFIEHSGKNPFSISLLETGLIRAKIMHSLCENLYKSESVLQEKSFLIGLLSVLPALYETNSASIMKGSAFDQEIIDAVIGYEGRLGKLLKLATDAENERFSLTQASLGGAGIDLPEFTEILREAYAWADEITQKYRP